MLDKVLTSKVNPKTKDDIEEIARQWKLTPSTVVRAALYLFLEDYLNPYSASPKIIPMLQHAKENAGRLKLDDLVEVTFAAEPVDGKARPTIPAPPELLEELEGKALLLELHMNAKYRREQIDAIQKRLAEKAQKPPEGQ